MRLEMGTGMETLLPSMHVPVRAQQLGHTVCPCPGLGRRPSSPELPVVRQLVGGVIAEQPCVPIQQVDIDMLLGERGSAHVCANVCAHPRVHRHTFTNTPLLTHRVTCRCAHMPVHVCTIHTQPWLGGAHEMALALCPATTSIRVTRIRATSTLGPL